MQQMVDDILHGSETVAQRVLDMAILNRSMDTEYTISDSDMIKVLGIMGNTDDRDELRADAIAKLVACSKDLSLRYLSLLNRAIDRRAAKVIDHILCQQEYQEKVWYTVNKKILENLRNGLSKDLVSLLQKHTDMALENLDLLFYLAHDSRYYDDVYSILIQHDHYVYNCRHYFTEEDCDMVFESYLYDNDVEDLAFHLLECINIHDDYDCSLDVIEKLLDKGRADIACVLCIEDLFTLMHKYPSRIEILDIKSIEIYGDEKGFEHCVKFIESCSQTNITNKMKRICEFLTRVGDISPFFHILLEHLDDIEVQKLLVKKSDTLGPYLPQFVNSLFENINEKSLEFLIKVYAKCDNKEEIKEKVLILIENSDLLDYTTLMGLFDMFDGDLPTMNRTVYEKCIQILLQNPLYVRELSPKYRKIMIKHYIYKGNVDHLLEMCDFPKVREFDKLFVDLIIRSNNQLLLRNIWDFANGLRTNYAIENAYVYGDFNFPVIEKAFLEKWKSVPNGYVVPRFIKDYLRGWKFPHGELLASVYNIIDCKIHITLIKSFTYRALNDEFRFNLFYLAHNLSGMVLKLNKIDHRDELRAILVSCLQEVSKEYYSNKIIIKRAIERLGGCDECHVLQL